MKRHVLDKDGNVLCVEEAEPECGEDFCANCGECLHCYVSDPCDEGREEHSWVVREKAQEEG